MQNFLFFTSMSKRLRFPFVVKSGSASTTIYLVQSKKGYRSFQVRFYRGSEQVRITRSNFKEAHEEARSAAQSLARGELDILTLRNDERQAYVRAVELLRPTGVDIETATREYTEARALLGGVSLLEAARDYAQRQAQSYPTKSVAEVAAELVRLKTDNGREEVYVKDLRLRLDRFVRAFNCPVRSISTLEVEEFLVGLKLSGRTQNNFRRIIGTLMRFATKRGYLPKDHPGISEIELATQAPSDVQIFTPKEMSNLLAIAEPEIIPFIALGAFAGLRHAEIKRLDWEDIHFQSGHIELKAKKSKTRIRRLIPIHDNLREWLAPHASERGPVTQYANMTKQLLLLGKKADVVWKHNGVRHSYVSYRVAETQDIQNSTSRSGG
jgi:integrase